MGPAIQVLVPYPYPSFLIGLMLRITVAFTHYLYLVGGGHIKIELPLSKYFNLGTKYPALIFSFINSSITFFTM